MQSRHRARDTAGDAEEEQSTPLDMAHPVLIPSKLAERAERIRVGSVRHSGRVAA